MLDSIFKYSLFIFLLSFSAPLFSQVDFDTLTLNYGFFDMSGGNTMQFKIYDANISIDGYNCHEISRYNSHNGTLSHHGYITYEGDSILWYDEIDENFKLQYDFSAEVNDTIYIPNTQYVFLAETFNFKLLVTETSYLYNENATDSLRVLTTKEIEMNGIPNTNDWGNIYYGPQHIQYAGSTNFFTPYTGVEEIGFGLRCIDFDGESFYKLTVDECDLASSIPNNIKGSGINIFPNPMYNDDIYIELEENIINTNNKLEIELISVLGQQFSL